MTLRAYSLSVLTDANIILSSLSTALFPGVSSSVKVHSGFKDAHASTAAVVLATVKKILAEKGATKVTLGKRQSLVLLL